MWISVVALEVAVRRFPIQDRHIHIRMHSAISSWQSNEKVQTAVPGLLNTGGHQAASCRRGPQLQGKVLSEGPSPARGRKAEGASSAIA